MAPLLVDIIRISLPSQEISKMFELPRKVPRLEECEQSDKMNSFVTVNSYLRLFLSKLRFGFGR